MISLDVHSDSGLSLVEVLVALAITAMLAMAMTWFFSMVLRVRDVSEHSVLVDRALIRLVGLSANLGQSAPRSVIVKEGGNIEFRYEGVGVAPYSALVEVAQDARSEATTLHATGATLPEVTVDLGAFESQALEAFGRHEAKGEWRDIDGWPPGTPVDGLRLRLSLMSRTWFPVIWARTFTTGLVNQ